MYANEDTIFSFKVMIDTIVDIWGYNVTLEYDPDVLKYDGVALSDLLAAANLNMTATKNSTSDGLINVFAYYKSTVSAGEDTPPRTNILFTITMEAKATPAPSTTINVTEAKYYNGTTFPGTEYVADLPAEPHLTVLPIPAGATTLEWINHWTDLKELDYWDQCIQEFEANMSAEGTPVYVVSTNVAMDFLYNTIMTRFAAGQMPDMISQDAMWIPKFVDSEVLSAAPDYIKDDITDNWAPGNAKAVEYMRTTWGYPTENNAFALFYNKVVLAQVGATNVTVANALATLIHGGTLLWGNGTQGIGSGQLEKVAEACTTYNSLTKIPANINRTGFWPIWLDYQEGNKQLFMSMLWSNGGEFIDWNVPEAIFNSTEGVQVLELYKWCNGKTFDGTRFPDGDIWWNAWATAPSHGGNTEIVMMILPTWMYYVKDAMGAYFNNATVGLAPIPIGPSGSASHCITHPWALTVAKASELRRDTGALMNHSEAAWKFYQWVNTPQPLEASYGIALLANHTETNVSRFGEFLVTDSIVPSRISDGAEMDYLQSDFWLKSFIYMGNTYGQAEAYFRSSQLMQLAVGTMCDTVGIGGDPQTEADETAEYVTGIIPIPGDLIPDELVDIFDVTVVAVAFGAEPGDSNWNPRADPMPDYDLVDIFDITVCAVNFGRKSALYVE